MRRKWPRSNTGGSSRVITPKPQWCRTRQGQVIACENVGATWLPFEPLRDFQSARPGGVSREAVWLGGVAVGDQVEPDGMRREAAEA